MLAKRAGPMQGPLLGYETFTASLLEATFFGIMLFGRDRVPPWIYFLSCCMVALGTTFLDIGPRPTHAIIDLHPRC